MPPAKPLQDSFALNENRFHTITSVALNADGKSWTVGAFVNGSIHSGVVRPAKDYTPTIGSTALFRRTENGLFIMKDYPTQ